METSKQVPAVCDLFSSPAQRSDEGQDQGAEPTCPRSPDHLSEEDRKYGQTQQQESPPQGQVLLPTHRRQWFKPAPVEDRAPKRVSRRSHLVLTGKAAEEQTQDQTRHHPPADLQQPLQDVHPRGACRADGMKNAGRLGNTVLERPLEKEMPRQVEKPVMARTSSKLPAAISSVGIP